MSAVLQSNPSDPVLRVDDLSIEYRTRGGNVRAVREVSFSIGRGETFGVVGESGSGKSVTALSVLRLLETATYSGVIRFEGEDLLQKSEREMRKWQAIHPFVVRQAYHEPA